MNPVRVWSLALCAVTLFGLTTGVARPAPLDYLFVGDGLDDTVKRFDALTGAYVDTLVDPGSGGLRGPRGMVFDQDGNLLVVNQNVNTPLNGEVLRYDAITGEPLGALVSSANTRAPWAPRGVLVGPDNLLYVADMGDESRLGQILRFDAATGDYKSRLTVSTGRLGVQFHPRGLVFGPDGLLYASNFEPEESGSIVRFDVETGTYVDQFVPRVAGGGPLRRAEGISFGPDGNLYAISFPDPNRNVVLSYDGQTGNLLDTITVSVDPNVYAEALLFGPNGNLFVPMAGSGEVLRYDFQAQELDGFVPDNGVLGEPWFLTFGATDPATLQYKSPGGLEGDYNGNEVLDAGDLDLQAQAMQAPYDVKFDLNRDGSVNFDDRKQWVSDLKKTYIGDANLSNEFNSADLIDVFGAGKYEQGVDATWGEGDFDGDLRFGSGDLVEALADGGYESGPRGTVSAVPEPAGLALLGTGLLLTLTGIRRKS